jgi:hypothetical protein
MSDNLIKVETDVHGNVVAVLFNEERLPFEQISVNLSRAQSMRDSYKDFPPTKITNISVE